MLNFAAICPHPPLIIPEIGGSQIILAKKTIDALEKGNGRNHVIAQAILHLISEDAETRIRFFFDKFGPR